MRDVYDIFFREEIVQAMARGLRGLMGFSALVHYRLLMSLCCILPANVQSQPSEEPQGLVYQAHLGSEEHPQYQAAVAGLFGYL